MEQEIESHLIYTFPRSKDEKVHFTLRKYRGKFYMDIRVWYKTGDSEEFYPTKKGISVPVELISQLRKGIEQVSKSLEKSKAGEAAVLA